MAGTQVLADLNKIEAEMHGSVRKPGM